VRLSGGQGGEAVAEVGPELRELSLAVRRWTLCGPGVVLERIVAPGAPAQRHVTAGIQRQPMKPRRKRRLAAELAELDAELGESFLSGIASVLGVSEYVMGEPPDAGRMTLAERLESASVTVLRAPDENRVAEPIVRKLGLGPKRSADSTAGTSRRLHEASLLPQGGVPAPVRRRSRGSGEWCFGFRQHHGQPRRAIARA